MEPEPSALQVAIVAGGPSGEAEVSRASARALAAGLESAGHVAVTLELAPELPASLLAQRPQVVFPIAHGPLGEDGALQGLLEVLGLAYVGAGVRASACCASKPTAKRLLAAAGVPVAAERLVLRGDVVPARALASQLAERLVVKPAEGGSALGVTRLPGGFDDAALEAALQSAWAFGPGALVEPLIDGLEVTCGVLDLGQRPRALPPTTILPAAADWYDFASKYGPEGSRHVCPADLPPDVFARVQELALAAHQAVGARDLSRVDFLVQDSRITALEVNTLPGFTATSLYPEAAAAAGIAFPELCDRLVRQAHRRGPRVVTDPVASMPPSPGPLAGG